MKALTLTQPWATLVAVGAKRFETRSWSTAVRGPVAIHAAKGFSDLGKRGFLDVCAREPFRSVLTDHRLAPADLRLGAIVAVVTLAQTAKTERVREYLESIDRRTEVAFGDYTAGRWAYELVDLRQVAPITCAGALGFWDVPAEIERLLGVAVPA